MVLIVALMFLTLLSVLGAAGIMTSTTDMKIACANRSAAKALHIAEAGLTRAEAELINDLDTDQDIGNTSFEATSGAIDLTGLLSSTSFYTVFNAISFGSGSYTIEFKNYAPDPITAPTVYDPTTVWARSIGTGPSLSTITLESYLSAENLSPWNNAIFAGGGGGAVPITGNVVIAGSVHILGEGLPAGTIVFSNQTGDCRNTNTGMDGTLAAAINGGTTSDLNAKFRVKNGRVDMSVGTADIGSSTSPLKGIYVTTGTDAGADGVNDDIIGGDNSGAGQNLYADKGAFSAQAYDLGDYNISMPTIDTAWMDANCLDLTAGGGVDEYVGPGGNQKGLIAGALELTWDYNVTGTNYFPNIDQNDVTTFEDSHNAIRFNSVTNVLEIKGIVKVSTLNISDDITYEGRGTIYTTGTGDIDGDVLPNANNSYPITHVFGVVGTGDMTLGGSSQILLTGAYFCKGKVTTNMQTELSGTIVCESFNISSQVPKIWQVPSLANNLPPGMPGAAAIWVFTDRTWREITQE